LSSTTKTKFEELKKEEAADARRREEKKQIELRNKPEIMMICENEMQRKSQEAEELVNLEAKKL
jgi:hypothetical protein